MHVLRQKMLFARFLTRRFTKVTIPLRDEKMKYEEIKIPVPWGELAGKWWGSKNQRPILCIHGWQVSQKKFFVSFLLGYFICC